MLEDLTPNSFDEYGVKQTDLVENENQEVYPGVSIKAYQYNRKDSLILTIENLSNQDAQVRINDEKSWFYVSKLSQSRVSGKYHISGVKGEKIICKIDEVEYEIPLVQQGHPSLKFIPADKWFRNVPTWKMVGSGKPNPNPQIVPPVGPWLDPKWRPAQACRKSVVPK